MNSTIQAPPSEPQVWGAQQPPSGWTTKKTLAAVAVAAGIAVVGGGVIYVASQSSSAQQGFPGGPGMSMNRDSQNGTQGTQGTQSMPLHGEYVVSDNNGGYITELTQTGTVTEVSATSVTAISADDYEHTYVVSGSVASGIAVGDSVTIRATETDGTATISAITEGMDGAGTPMDGQLPRQQTGGLY